MTVEKLQQAQKLLKEINHLKNGLKDLDEWIDSANKARKDNLDDDGNYRLSLCEHSDGSGRRVELYRYKGNNELLRAIRVILERQKAENEKEFEEL